MLNTLRAERNTGVSIIEKISRNRISNAIRNKDPDTKAIQREVRRLRANNETLNTSIINLRNQVNSTEETLEKRFTELTRFRDQARGKSA